MSVPMVRNRKIDIYRVRRDERGRRVGVTYLCSTNWSRTCRDAVAHYREAKPEIGHAELVAYYEKGAR